MNWFLPSWTIGVFLAAFSSIISNFGLNLQKLTHVRNKTKAEQKEMSKTDDLASPKKKARHLASPPKVNYAVQPLWILGLSLVILGSFADFAALYFAPQTIIAPLGSLTLVSNTIFAPFLLNEKFSRRDLAATGAIVIGAALAVAFASHADTDFTFDQLFGFYTQTRFIVYSGAVFLAITVLVLLIRRMDHIQKTNELKYSSMIHVHRFCYAAASGVMGAQSVLFAKCTAELIANSIAGKGLCFARYQTYIILVGLFVTIFFQIRWLNSGLRRFDALYIVPVFQSFWILVSVISGMVFFGEYEDIFENLLNSIMFPLGVIITISGVYVLSQRAITDPDDPVSDASLTQPLIDSKKDPSDKQKHTNGTKGFNDKDGYCACKPDQLCTCTQVSVSISPADTRTSHLYSLNEPTLPVPVGKGSVNTDTGTRRIGSRVLRRRTSQEVFTVGLLGRLSIVEDETMTLESTPQSPLPDPEELTRGISLQRAKNPLSGGSTEHVDPDGSPSESPLPDSDTIDLQSYPEPSDAEHG